MHLEYLHNVGLCSAIVVLQLSLACSISRQSPVDQTGQQESIPVKNINAVLKDNQDRLMALQGVVGVYVGLLPDDKTTCLKVMVVKETEDLRNQIPKSLEGYQVLIEESGVIRPLTEGDL
jgi:hypothetical protein